MAATRRKPVIGLLGGPGSGKSLVAAQFAKLGCAVVDADRLAREALGEEGVLEQLTQWWGPGVLGPDGKADRKAIAAIVFGRPEELARLESVLHPRVAVVREREHEAYQGNSGVVAIVEDTPLLLEKNLEGVCDVLIFVEAPREVRLERVARTRGWDEKELARREKNQLSLDTKRRRSDHVLDNSGGEAQTYEQARRLLSLILHERN